MTEHRNGDSDMPLGVHLKHESSCPQLSKLSKSDWSWGSSVLSSGVGSRGEGRSRMTIGGGGGSGGGGRGDGSERGGEGEGRLEGSGGEGRKRERSDEFRSWDGS